MQQVYEVEDILDEAVINNEPHYLIKWRHHPHEDDTWEPISELAAIVDYLQHWLRQRQLTLHSRTKQNQTVAYQTIRPFIPTDQLRPQRKTIRQKYAEEILTQKKTWQRYIEEEEKAGQGHQGHQEQDYKPHQNRRSKMEPFVKVEENFGTQEGKEVEENTKMEAEQPREEERPLIPTGVKQEPDRKEAKVVGSVNASTIARIVRVFRWKGLECAELELVNGRRCNMQREELERCSPLMLLAFLEDQGVTF